jgi:competence protein ComEC
MLKWHTIPFVRLLLPFILGILLAYFQFNIQIAICVSLGLALAQFYVFKKSNSIENAFKLQYFKGLILIVAVLLLGYLHMGFKNPLTNSNHYAYASNSQVYTLRIHSNIKNTENYHQSYAVIESVLDAQNQNLHVFGKTLLRIPKSVLKQTPKIGDRYQATLIELKSIKEPNYSDEFNYKKFMEKEGITHVVKINEEGKLLQLAPKSSLKRTSTEIREKCRLILAKYIDNTKALGLSEALLLGYKNDLDIETKSTFSETGTMHLLAVSGLHVGMFYMLIFFFTNLWRNKYWSSFFQPLIILVCLWSFAFISGLSSSVVRSVIMFSILLLAKLLKRRHTAYNTIGASAFLMLLYDPYQIIDVGFQLSYSAVFGIVFLHPKLIQIVRSKNKILNYFTELTSVSLSAQLFTFPLSLYYFHQFPNYFLISNLVSIPLITLTLIGLIGLIACSFFAQISTAIGFIITQVLGFNEQVLEFFSKLPFAVSREIQVNQIQIVLIYIGITSILVFAFYKLKPAFFTALTSCLLFIALLQYRNCKISNNQSITHRRIWNQEVYICHESTKAYVLSSRYFIEKNGIEKTLKNYLQLNGAKETIPIKFTEKFKSRHIIVAPRLGFQFFDKIMTMPNYVHFNSHRIEISP